MPRSLDRRLSSAVTTLALTVGLLAIGHAPARAQGCGDDCDPTDYTSTLTVQRPDLGTIRSDDGALDCPAAGGGTCQVTDVQTATGSRPSRGWPRYRLSATGLPDGFTFSWNGPCSGATTCTVTNDHDATVGGQATDTQAPVISHLLVNDVIGPSSAVAVVATDNVGVTGYDWTVCDAGGCSASASHGPSITVGGGRSSGPVTVTVGVHDAQGNDTEASRTVEFDADAPSVTFSPPAQGAAVNSSAVAVSFEAHDRNLSGTQCSVDGGARVDCTSPWTATGLSAHSIHTIAVFAGDAGGNTWEQDLVVDAEPARLTVGAPLFPLTWQGGLVLIGGLPAGATGVVDVRDHETGALLCAAPLDGVTAGSSCSVPPRALEPGAHVLDAVYAGDGTVFGASTTSPTTVFRATQNADAPAVTGRYGSSHPLTLTGLQPDAGGTVTFSGAGRMLCRAAVRQGRATCAVSTVPGRYTVTAAFSGDPHYAAQTFTTMLTVARGATRLVARPRAVTGRLRHVARITVSGLPMSAAGRVAITDGRRTVCTVQVRHGGATCATPRTLACGRYVLTASYSGSALWSPSSTRIALRIT